MTLSIKLGAVGVILGAVSLIGGVAHAETGTTQAPVVGSDTQNAPASQMMVQPTFQAGQPPRGGDFREDDNFRPMPPVNRMMGSSSPRMMQGQGIPMNIDPQKIANMTPAEREAFLKKMMELRRQQEGQGNVRDGRQTQGGMMTNQGRSVGTDSENRGIMMNGNNSGDENSVDQATREADMVKKQSARITQLLQKNLMTLNKRADKLKVAGIPLTTECADLNTTFSDAMASAKNATSFDDLLDAQDAMQSMQDYQECRMIIEKMLSVPRLLKTASSTVARFAKRGGNSPEASGLLQDAVSQWSDIKSSPASNDDVQALFDTLEQLHQVFYPPRPQVKQEPTDMTSAVLDSVANWFNF